MILTRFFFSEPDERNITSSSASGDDSTDQILNKLQISAGYEYLNLLTEGRFCKYKIIIICAPIRVFFFNWANQNSRRYKYCLSKLSKSNQFQISVTPPAARPHFSPVNHSSLTLTKSRNRLVRHVPNLIVCNGATKNYWTLVESVGGSQKKVPNI